MEPSAVENNTASAGTENFNPEILFVRSWPELWKARKIRRNIAKSISAIKGSQKWNFRCVSQCLPVQLRTDFEVSRF